LEKLIHDAQEESDDQEEDDSEETQEEVQRTEEDVLTWPENILEGDIWGDGNIESTAAEEIYRSSETGEN
jgi:hypothetical protein